MKIISLLIITIVFASCILPSKLNKRIDESQRLSHEISPFNPTKGDFSGLKLQKRFRQQYEKDLTQLMVKFPEDTIIMTENYDFICAGCPADYIQIFQRNTLHSYNLNLEKEKYEKSTDMLSDDFVDSVGNTHGDIYELFGEIKNGDSWNKNPEKYGTDKCFDGSLTFYTVFYPSGKIESMYMRCWIPKDYRNK